MHGKRPRKKRLKKAFMAAAAALGLLATEAAIDQLPKNPNSDTQDVTSYLHSDGTIRGYNISPKDQLWKQTLGMRDQAALNDELLVAAANGDSWRVRALYEQASFAKGVSVDALNSAVAGVHKDVVTAILQHAPETGKDNASAIGVSLGLGTHSMTDFLITHPAFDRDSRTGALVNAVAQRNHTALALLLENGADARNLGSSAYILAVTDGNAEAVRLLLAAGADINAQNGRALTTAASRGDGTIVDIILSQTYTTRVPVYPPVLDWDMDGGGLWRNDIHQGAWYRGASYGHDWHPPLLSHGGWEYGDTHYRTVTLWAADVHANNGAALMAAVQGGHSDIVQKLINAGASVNAHSGAPLSAAAANGDAAMVRKLLSAGAAAQANDSAALYQAVLCGNADVCRLLIRAGADPLAQNGGILSAAGQSENTDVLLALVENAFLPPDSGYNPGRPFTP
jgi:ankyrin repeat protein